MSEEQNNEPRQDAQPMDPERLADLREGLDDNRVSERPVPHDLVSELLADRDRLEALAKALGRQTQRLNGVIAELRDGDGAGS